ncbi:DUF1493 family protein [Caulobacter endophyticus]|uniref:DUF1493 family protein n=1 Tax=Caulobacter endophyticus TaxID=2172652 RepID=UPI00241047C2|nr:DUF1493 family protein [Caulobacter endophyticus]MDG2531330.1 DUF1493 family protein [Caulobacter endophyticus]
MESSVDRVAALVVEHMGAPAFPITRATRLLDDLGIDGDDADAFFRDFGARFGVDLAPLHARWDRHFGNEADWRLSLPTLLVVILLTVAIITRSAWAVAGGVLVVAAAIFFIWRSLRRNEPNLPVTVGDLIEAVETGRWPLRYEDEAKVDRTGLAR